MTRSALLLTVFIGLSVLPGKCQNATAEATALLQLQHEISINTTQEFTDDFFEGPEKTLMLKFSSAHLSHGSLRNVPDEAWRGVMEKMGISILSKVESLPQNASRGTGHSVGSCTAYLLSESSLFVYSDRVVFKTCGLSSPLRGIRPFLDVARGPAATEDVGLEQVMYSHPAYLRQQDQHAPHRSWEEERSFLKQLFPTGSDIRLGTPERGTDLFVANFAVGSQSPWVAAEIYITDLEQPTALSTFSRDSKAKNTAFWSAMEAERIDEFYFDPSGYSANALRGNSYSTMHASPQPSVSYISHATNALMSPEQMKQMVDDTLQLAPGRHIGVFLFTFLTSGTSAFSVNTSLSVKGYQQSGSWFVERPGFQTLLLSLTPQPAPTCVNKHAMSGTESCMIEGQTLPRCEEF